VLVPSFQGPANAVNDDWQVSEEVGMAYRLLNQVVARYNADRQRLYTTGQSMGGMISFYLNATHPDLFAASLFVGSQWDIKVLAPLAKKSFLYVVSAGDDKAAGGMAQVGKLLDEKGVNYGQTQFSARLPQAQQDAATRALLAQGKAINFIRFDKDTVAPAGTDSPGAEHMYSFDHAYLLTPVRDWLFQQRLTQGVGALYQRGQQAQDPQTALIYYRQAAQQGDGLAAYRLAQAYAEGRGVPQDMTQALAWYQLAIERHIPNAMLDLGIRYLNGQGVPQDYSPALDLFSEAWQLGDMKAGRYLGILYEEGLGVKPDYLLAQDYYQQAHAAGDITAAARLGWLYERGLGVPQSDAEALRWYRAAAPSLDEAARNIHPRVLALVKLGQFYETGRGVLADRQQARRWYQLAAQDRDPTALAALARLGS